MDADDRDQRLLALLDEEGRAAIESVVDEIVDDCGATGSTTLRQIASVFDARGVALPDDTQIVAAFIAAALRNRALASDPRH